MSLLIYTDYLIPVASQILNAEIPVTAAGFSLHIGEGTGAIYLPVIPLRTLTIKRDVTKPHIFEYKMVRYEKMSVTGILKPYFFSWIVMPLLLGGPMILCVREVAESIGIPVDDERGGLSTTWTITFVIALLYFVVALLKIKSWDEKRGLGKTKIKTDVQKPE